MTDQPNERMTDMHETCCECREIANDLGLPITSAVNVEENEEPKQCSTGNRHRGRHRAGEAQTELAKVCVS